jgi:hypothetical protein
MNQKQEGLALKWKLLIVGVMLVGAAEQIALDMALWKSVSSHGTRAARTGVAEKQRQPDSELEPGVAEH